MNIVVRLYLPFKSVCELLEVEDSVSILVKFGNQGNNIILKALVAMGTLLDLGNDLVKGGLREDIWVIFHIFLGVFIGLEELELESTKEDGVTKKEVTLNIIVVANWVAVLLALHELTSDTAGVFIAHFINLNGVVSTIEGYDEATRLIIRLSRDKLRVKSENMHILLEHLLHINLWWLWL